MKSAFKLLTLIVALAIFSCGSKEEKKKSGFSYEQKTATQQTNKSSEAPKALSASQRVDLTDKGIGPITSIILASEIDQNIASHGKDIFNKMCTACHRPDKKFIGPSPVGILEKRSPEWIMNMILNPEEMVQRNQLAKDLLIEFNGSPMPNQSLSEENARAILEYFRTLK
ncbi:c-type cytochrome [Aestuariibaculum suncheonense]|uniref:Cytochrome c n=1 Tax=Aestuariibaculum suncheonense TaxID=1028745 RepID=A0A8J6UM22_9FLAO|nr:cytochrome c [Aestuariibaculum suncheonense]MBD0836611.1 cytochrome c [Aestuariibaculum suncheonense]